MDEPHPARAGLLATKMLSGLAATLAGHWEKFTGWLVAGLGASLALIIANMDKAKDMLPAATVSQAVKIFVWLLVVHTVQKILAIVVISAFDASKDDTTSKAEPPVTVAEAAALINHIEASYFFPFSLMITASFNRLRNGDFIHVGRRIIRLALASTLLAMVQVVLAVWAVWVIARGLV